MTNTIHKLMVSACLWGSCGSMNAAVFTNSVSANNSMISASTLPNGAGDGAGLLWSINLGATLEPFTYTIGIGHVWYQATTSDIIDPGFTGTGLEFANAFTGYTGGSIGMTSNSPFFLGFWLDSDGDSIADSDDRYGWAELVFDGSNLSLLGSAISDSGSIGVGAIPEPSTHILLIGSCMFSIAYRRRNKR